MLSATAPVDAENLLAAQSEHVPVPVTVLYFPPKHAEHVPPLGPEYPVLQTQIVDAIGDCEFDGQA